METGVGPGKIRLGFAWGPSASACHPPAGGHTRTRCFGVTARSDVPHAPTSGAQITAGVGDSQCHAQPGGLAACCCGQWHREVAVTPLSRLPSSLSSPSLSSALWRTSQRCGGAGSDPTPRTPTCSHRPRSPTWAFPAPPELPASGPPFWHRGRWRGAGAGREPGHGTPGEPCSLMNGGF